MKIAVLAHPTAGIPRPRAFQLGARRVPVASILEQWQAEGDCYFRVCDLNGRRFVLRHCPSRNCWELQGVYPAAVRARPAA